MKQGQKNPLSKKAGALEALISDTTGEESKAPRSEQTGEGVRATFIVEKKKLQLLKDYAYIERKQIKDVVDEMLTEFLSKHFDNSKAINGNTWDE